MTPDLFNRLANLSFYGYLEPFKKIVTVHFFNEKEDKPDVIAYLKPDMSWDVREITSEESTLSDTAEVITVHHKRISTEPKDSPFDEFVRLGLKKMAEQVHGEEVNLAKIDPVFEVLENDSY